MDLARVVLVETHTPGNIGSVARVLANMGVHDLVLVAPRAEPTHPEAVRFAASAAPILSKAPIVTDLDTALADCTVVAGTSARTGSLFRRQNVGSPEVILCSLIQAMREGSRAALVFGPEPTGLCNDAITRCHHLIRIPTADDYPALNLAQAVAICVYELRRQWEARTDGWEAPEPRADHAAQDAMFRELQTALEEIHFLYGPKAATLMHGLRHLLGKARPSPMEVKLLLGIARQIRWYAKSHEGVNEDETPTRTER